jgi:RHS repeat-associated protein
MAEKFRVLSVLLLLTCPCLGTSIVLQDESFDTYANGTDLHGVGGWAGWDNDPAFSAIVTQIQSKSAPQAVDIKLDADLVQEFPSFETGAWSYSGWQYIPSNFTSAGGGQFAGSYFNLLNRYTAGVAHNEEDWSVQMQFDSNDGMLKVFHGAGVNDTINVPYETDRWVKIQAIVDLENDWTQIYYDDTLITEYNWTGGVLGGGGGALDIAIVDLFAGGSSSIYYDDLRLERIYPLPENDEPGTIKLHSDYNRDFYVDLLDLLEHGISWLGGVTVADVIPLSCGDGQTDFGDFSQLQAEWQQCINPADALCIHKPLTLYEPPSQSHPIAAPCTGGCGSSCSAGIADSNPLFGCYGHSGEFYDSVVDLRIAGRGLDFAWSRKYRSRIGPNTAMGNGWDFSYNIYIEQCGPDLLLHDGNTREDTYLFQPDGTWAADGFFREFTQDPNTGAYTLTFPDTGVWEFLPLDGSPAAGRINEIRDRNDNTLRLEYDAAGRLERVQDTLHTAANPREIVVDYNRNGFIESVTDFVGRQVRYEYYDDVEAGGSYGDLKSVRTPVVTGTPTGNDFVDGKTTVYTYSTGFADERLNHNLLTLTDPKGQTFLVNTYAPTIDPADFNFDRLISQTWGDPTDRLDAVYAPVAPSALNDFAVLKVTGNDRVGNISESFYDHQNRLVIDREHTGRAIADLPTDLDTSLNPPVGPLRASDPVFFETRYQWNVDSLVSQIVQPNGNSVSNVYEFDLDPLAARRSRGNLRESHALPGPLGGDQSQIDEFFEYDTDLGGCCGTNFVTRYTDGRGNETTYDYDSNGNRLQTTNRIRSIVEDYVYNAFGQMILRTLPDNGSGHRRIDSFTYYGPADGCMNGYLKEDIIDEPGFALTTTYVYDCLGRMIRRIDPRGHDSLTEYNSLDQIVNASSRRVSDPNGVRYELKTYYDFNDNVVRTDRLNVDDLDILQPNTDFTTVYEYDILNYMTRTCSEVGDYNGSIPGTVDAPICTGLPDNLFITEEYEYDGERNQTLVRNGEATEGRQPHNRVATFYDERNLVFLRTRGPGSADQATVQYDYDGNGNILRTHEGLEDTPRVMENQFDGFDRLTVSIDPMGNRRESHYDENSNKVSVRIDGELIDLPGDASNVRLGETTYVYDLMDRRTRTITEFFDADTQSPLPGGQQQGRVITDSDWSDISQLTRITDDNLHVTLVTYDTANRNSVVTDAKGNTKTNGYDQNSNIISITEVEKSDLLNPDETFVTTYVYDNLDRLIRKIDPVGNSTLSGYDSRGNTTVITDALGRETRTRYDGTNRVTQMVRDLDGDGADGDGTDILTGLTWDDSSRAVERIDDNGNTSTTTYDALGRVVAEELADQTVHTYQYDVHDNQVQRVDANGTTVTATYDLLNRETDGAIVIVVGSGVSNDTTFETNQFDGLSRVGRTEDDDTVLVMKYDSLSRVTSETLTIAGGLSRTTTCTYDGVGNELTCTYPGSIVIPALQINTTYDELNRKKRISDNVAPFAEYFYIGLDRVERRVYSPNFSGGTVHTDYEYDGILPNPTNDFGVKQVVRSTAMHVLSGQVIDDRTYSYDPLYNKKQRKDIRTSGPQLTYDYEYDQIYRLQRTLVTDPAVGLVRDEQYTHDGVHNRTSVTGTGVTNPGSYHLEPNMPPSDFQMHQYTATPFDDRQYDENGNLNLVQQFGLPLAQTRTYDYRNQMITHVDPVSGATMTNSYDTLGRRVRTQIIGGPTTHYYYYGQQVVEEQDNFGNTQTRYIYGRYIDEVLVMLKNPFVEHFFHTDDLYNVMAVTDSNGNALERYDYADYGLPSFFDGVGNPIGGTSIGNPYLFNGRRYDSTTGLYYFRSRYLDPAAGRFTVRDSIGMWGDPGNLGNAYTYVGNNPWTYTDPFGLMNKSELIDSLAKKSSISKADAKRALDGVIGAIGRAKKGDKVSLVGFGSFTCSGKKARAGRNPQTGEAIKIKATKIVEFKAAKVLKDAVNSASSSGHAEYVKNVVTGSGTVIPIAAIAIPNLLDQRASANESTPGKSGAGPFNPVQGMLIDNSLMRIVSDPGFGITMPGFHSGGGASQKKSREIVVVGSKVKDIVRSAGGSGAAGRIVVRLAGSSIPSLNDCKSLWPPTLYCVRKIKVKGPCDVAPTLPFCAKPTNSPPGARITPSQQKVILLSP